MRPGRTGGGRGRPRRRFHGRARRLCRAGRGGPAATGRTPRRGTRPPRGRAPRHARLSALYNFAATGPREDAAVPARPRGDLRDDRRHLHAELPGSRSEALGGGCWVPIGRERPAGRRSSSRRRDASGAPPSHLTCCSAGQDWRRSIRCSRRCRRGTWHCSPGAACSTAWASRTTSRRGLPCHNTLWHALVLAAAALPAGCRRPPRRRRRLTRHAFHRGGSACETVAGMHGMRLVGHAPADAVRRLGCSTTRFAPRRRSSARCRWCAARARAGGLRRVSTRSRAGYVPAS